MQIKNLVIKQKKDYYILDFEITFEKESNEWTEWTENWTTINFKSGKWYFNHIVYRIDEDKKEALRHFSSKQKNIFKTPEPYLYYDLENTIELIDLLYKEKAFQELIKEKNLLFDKKQLFHKKALIKRMKNLKNCIIHAYNHNEHIGIIGPNAEYYIPLSAIEIGVEILTRLPKGEMYEAEDNGLELIEDFLLACNNTEVYKRYSFIWCRISKDGVEDNLNDHGHLHFAWELEEEALFFDELFFSDCMVKIADKYIFQENKDNLEDIFLRCVDFDSEDEDEDEDEFIDYNDIPYDGFDLMDIIIWDDEGIFNQHQWELDFNKEKYIKKIAKDFGINSYEQFLDSNDFDKG